MALKSQHINQLIINLLLIVCSGVSLAQIPIRPNQYDADSLRTGEWVLLYDSAYSKKVTTPDSAHFYCFVSFEKGIPTGKVECYYANGIKQWDGKLLTVDPDIKHGRATFYYPLGNVQEKVIYVNDHANGDCEGYYENGQLQYKGTMTNDSTSGYWEFYYENGQLTSKGNFTKGVRNGYWEFYHENGQLLGKGLIDHDHYQGDWTFYYSNGNINYTTYYVDGKKNGKYVGYHENGQMSQIGHYVNDLQDGHFKYFHENGQLDSEGEIVTGLYQGKWDFYYSNGNLASNRVYTDDIENGYFTYYYEDGTKKAEGLINNDKWNDTTTFYYPNGMVSARGKIENGLYQGAWKSFYDNGNIQAIKTYKNDTLNGYWQLNYENGMLNEKGVLVFDSKEGNWEIYYPNGQLKFKGPFRNDIRDGYFEYYNEDGTPLKKGKYFGDTEEGPFEYYFENGKLKSKGTYENGQKIGNWEFYHDNGKISTKGLFVNGKSEGLWQYYYPNGTLDCEGLEHLGKGNGYWKYYYDNGVQFKEGELKNGNREGFWKYYHPNGQIHYFGNTHLGDGIGIWSYYDSLGRKQSEGPWVNNLKEGEWVYYDTLGRVKELGNFVKNKAHGKWITYEEGKKVKKELYHRGMLIDFYSLKDSVYNLSYRFKLDSALKIAKLAKKYWKREYGKNDKDYHVYQRMMGQLYHNIGDNQKALEHYNQALEQVKRIEGDASWNYAISLGDLASLQYDLGHYNTSVDYYLRSLNAIEQLEGKKDISYFITVQKLSYAYVYNDQHTLAFKLLEEDIKFRLDSAADQKDNIIEAMAAIAELKYRNSQYDSALVSFQKYFKYLDEIGEQDHLTIPNSYRHMGYIFNGLLKEDSANYYFKKSIASHKRLNQIASTGLVYNYISLADYYFGNDIYDEAIQYADTAIYICENYGLTKLEAYIEALIVKAKPLFSSYHDAEAYDYYKKANELAITNQATQKKFISQSYQGMALCETKLYPDKPEVAEETYKKSIALFSNLNEFQSQFVNTSILLGKHHLNYAQYERAKNVLINVKEYISKFESSHHYYEGKVNEELGRLFYVQYQYDSAVKYYDAALVAYGSKMDQNTIEYSKVLNLKASIYSRLEKYDEAEQLLLESVNIIEKSFGKQHIQYAINLTELAYFYREKFNYSNAIVLYKQALELKEKLYGRKTLTYVNTQFGLAITYKYNENYEDALRVLEDLKQNLLSYSSKNDRDYLYYLEHRGDILNYQDKFNEAEACFKELTNLSEKMFGSSSEKHAYHLKETANFYKYNGKFDKALHFLAPAVNIIETQFGKNNVQYVSYAELLGQVFYAQENYIDALKIKEEIIDIFKNIFGEESDNCIEAKWSLAKLYKSLGRFPESEQLFKEIMSISKKNKGKYSLTYSQLAESMGGMYLWWGKPEKTVEMTKMTINILDSMENTHETHYYTPYNLIALALQKLKRYDESEEYLIKAREGALKNWGKGDRYYTYTNNLAYIYLVRGDFDTSEKLYLEAGSRFDNYETINDLDLVNYEDNLAALYLAWGKLDKAEEYWTRVTEILLKKINSSFAYMSESEKANFWDAYKKDFEYFNSYALKASEVNPKAIGQMYDNQLQTKSILLSSSTKERRKIINSGDSLLISNYFEYISLKEQLAKFYSYTAEQLKAETISIDSLEKVANNYEKSLSLNAKALSSEEKAKKIRWRNIQRSLNDNEAVVEMIRFRYFEYEVTDSVIYAALILTKETKKSPELVILPNGSELELKYLKNYKNTIRYKLKDDYSYKEYWQAIDEKLKGKSVVFFAPDGVFNQINVNTFRRPDGSYVIDNYNIKILTSSRDVLLLDAQIKKTLRMPVAALFGYPQYDLDHASIVQYIQERSLEKSRTLERDLDLERFGFSELPGTKLETESIEHILTDHNWDANLYLAHEALEEQLKAVQNPDVLHIATHGFFLEDTDDDLSEKLGVNAERGRENPLLRSGLLMAGAAQTVQGSYDDQTENGIFTAYEAMNLELNDTELVVLSACDTGRGELKSGEGVYGLQRAFQVAGAHSLIMSLWKVNDEATQLLMTNFYKNWLEGSSKSEAFKKAQFTVREIYPQPYYWGAFVLVGAY